MKGKFFKKVLALFVAAAMPGAAAYGQGSDTPEQAADKTTNIPAEPAQLDTPKVKTVLAPLAEPKSAPGKSPEPHVPQTIWPPLTKEEWGWVGRGDVGSYTVEKAKFVGALELLSDLSVSLLVCDPDAHAAIRAKAGIMERELGAAITGAGRGAFIQSFSDMAPVGGTIAVNPADLEACVWWCAELRRALGGLPLSPVGVSPRRSLRRRRVRAVSVLGALGLGLGI